MNHSRLFLIAPTNEIPMWIQTIFKALTSASTQPRGLRRDPPGSRLGLVALEDRWVPSFGLATNYDASYGPRSADVGDFNGDGRADVVSATLLGIAVRLNNSG